MFGIGMGPSPQQSALMQLLAQSNLAPGGGMNPPLPANNAAGGQDMGAPPLSIAAPAGEFAPRPVGMFGAGAMGKAPDGLPYADAPPQPRFGGGSMGNPPGALSFAGDQGSIAPVDQFALGRDLANLSHVDPIKAKGPGMFGKGGWGWYLLGALGDGLTAAGGGRPTFGPMMARKHEMEMERNNQLELWKIKAQMEREERMRPQIEQVGGSIGWLDPTEQSFKPFYTAPQPFEAYALARGLKPGTPEYAAAVQDYRLGAWSDPALERKVDLEGIRYGHRDDLQDQRLAVTRRGQDIRSSDARRGQDVRSRDARRGQDMTDTRVRDSASFQGKGGKGGKSGGPDLIGPIYQRGKARIQWSKSQNKYVAVN